MTPRHPRYVPAPLICGERHQRLSLVLLHEAAIDKGLWSIVVRMGVVKVVVRGRGESGSPVGPRAVMQVEQLRSGGSDVRQRRQDVKVGVRWSK